MTGPIIIDSYADFRAAIDRHRRARGLTLNALNFYAGLQEGYAEKLAVGVRNYGNVSLPNVLAALDLEIILTPKEI